MFEQLTRRDIYDEIQAQLAVPLQFEDWDRAAQHKEGDLSVSKYPAYPIWLSTRDMARIGYLMLTEGAWNGRQLMSRDWLRRIVSVVTPLGQMNPVERRDGYFGYGYMWWVWDGPRAVGPFKGGVHGGGCGGAVDHRVSVAGPRDRAQDPQRVPADHAQGLVGAHHRAAAGSKGVALPEAYPWTR